MLSNAYFLAKFRFDNAENEPAKNLQNFRKMHFSKSPGAHRRPPRRRLQALLGPRAAGRRLPRGLQRRARPGRDPRGHLRRGLRVHARHASKLDLTPSQTGFSSNYLTCV